MATYGRKLVDVNGNVILPKTRSSLVYMNNNETVEDTISKIISGKTVIQRAVNSENSNTANTANYAKTATGAEYANKADNATTATKAQGYSFYMSSLNTNAGIEAQNQGVRLSWGTAYSYKLWFGQDSNYGNALCLHPSSNGLYSLGNSSAKWSSVYSTSGAIQTSDLTKKESITDLNEIQLEFFKKLRPVKFKFKNDSDDKTNHDRYHYGFIAQEVETAMEECGISAIEFGGLCKDKEIILTKTISDNGEATVISDEQESYIYSLRYTEFVALNTAAIQALQKEVDILKNEIKILSATMTSNMQ